MATVARCEDYLARLPLPMPQRLALQRSIMAGLDHAQEDPNPDAAMRRLHGQLSGTEQALHQKDGRRNAALTSVAARLALTWGNAGSPPVTQNGRRLIMTPPLQRSSMAPGPWPPRFALWSLWPLSTLYRFRSHPQHQRGKAPERQGELAASGNGRIRRSVLAGLTVAQTIIAAWSMTSVLPYHGTQPLEMAILVLFSMLFFWISAGFWTAIMGFLLLLTGRDSYVTATDNGDTPIPAAARTAIVMPICNEDVARVFAGLRATYESLARNGGLEHFDFFILSDSGDPDLRVAETEAWLRLCKEVGQEKSEGRIFYRWRRNRIKRKSGNIADFCRRWGGNYRYMVVLDADSVMTGECLTRLVKLMEANPSAGIIQTAPRAVGRDTLHARMQQFASRLYGPLFAAGLHFWQLGESHYWGHNAIIRVAPFIRHCALGRLPKGKKRSVEILSHDFVEAALMRRAGWSVWIAHDLAGSFEETPPNLLDELKRDQRWCLGNLINLRLLFAEGLHPAHRVVFATGVMAYFSAPLWFLFLLLSTVLLAVHTLIPPQYFIHPYQLFPIWPQWHKEWAVVLAGATATLLFIPKILAALLALTRGARQFGGVWHLALSVAGESLYSMLLAPIRMLFHSQFVAAALAGLHTGWKSPPREDAETTWIDALRQHGWQALLGIVWAGGVFWLNPSYLWWLLPVTGALAVSIPISVWSSRASLGRWLRKARLFLIPEESAPPPEISGVRAYAWASQPLPTASAHDFVSAVVDPIDNAIACAAGSHLRPTGGAAAQAERRQRIRIALTRGPNALKPRDKMDLLDDPQLLSQLHFAVWSSPAAHQAWQTAMARFPGSRHQT